VTRVYTDLAVFLIGDEGVAVRDLFGCTFEELVDLLEVPLLDRAGNAQTMVWSEG
jgi:3-oxoadipate CoA-transferase beta subunit